MKKSIKYMRIAIWAIVAFLAFLTYTLYAVQSGLWTAVETNFEYSEAKYPQPSGTIPCSSETDSDCEVYIK